MKKKIIHLTFLGFFCLAYSLVCQADTVLSPVSTALSAKSFDPKHGEKFSISFQLPQAAKASVKIYNELGQITAEPFKGEVRKEVLQQVVWNGRDLSDKPVPPGVYYYTITAETDKGPITYNPYSQTQGHIITVLEGGYDEKDNQVYFKLPQAAMVRVRINLTKGGPIMATPVDWTPLPAGDYRFPWNGKDVSSLIDIKNHPNRNIMVYAYSLADNSIIVKGQTPWADKPFVVLNEDMMAKRDFPLNLTPDRYIHARKDPRLNHAARIDVTFPGAKLQNGLPVLSGKAAVRVTIDKRDQWIAEMSRYELMFYVDTVVVFEDESGFTPFTYFLNTKDLTPGEHVLTVNLLSYEDQYAVLSKKVMIK